MKSIFESKPKLIVAFILSLPILLHVYNPSMTLGPLFGFLLGYIGWTISPLILFGTLLYLIVNAKK
jgi:hypothetical protein